MEYIMLAILLLLPQPQLVCSLLAHTPECGDFNNNDELLVTKRVRGGHVSAADQWPWVVSVRVRGTDGHMTCGGSVIGRRWILTAAHCFEKKHLAWWSAGGQVSVSTGRRLGHVRLAGGSTYTADRVLFYPLRNHYSKGNLGPHDIALIRLQHAIRADDRVRPICLPDRHQRAALTGGCYVAGWGRTHVLQGASTVLRHVELHVTSRRSCSETLNMNIPSSQLCAVSRLGHTSCKGDSGGPLACLSRAGRYQLTGLVSYGPPCGLYTEPVPTVFTDVASYVPWVLHTVEMYGL